MNKIFKTKWNISTQTYNVCSELTKQAGKTIGSAVVFSVISMTAMATEISPNSDGRYIANGASGTITGTTTATIDNNIISIANGSNITINGDMTVNSRLSAVDGSNIVAIAGQNASLTAGKFTINGTTTVESQRLHPYALLVRNNASANIDDLTVNLKVPHEFAAGDAVGTNIDGGFGVAVGTEHFNSGTSTVTVKNATINISNTENSKLGKYYRTFWGINFPLLYKGGQITGLYVGTNTDAETTYTSTDLTKIVAQDISTDKTAGDYIMGVYVFGPKSKVILNDSDIKVASQGQNSFTLKIGNFENNGTSYKGEIVSNGKMKLDSTETPNAPTILLVSSDSKLDASAATASADIKSANSAIVFGVTDLVYKNAAGYRGDLSRNKSAENQSVKLNNAVISTKSEDASLIKAASALNVNSLANSQSGLTWSNGNFTTNNGTFTLSGKDSLATAAKNGWLFEAENGSTLTALINQKAKVIGLSSKNTSGTLNVTLDDATWQLAPKGDAATPTTESTLNNLTINTNGVLDASQVTDTTQNSASYNVKLTSDGTAVDGTLTNGGIITLGNGSYNDILTIDGNYVGNNGIIKLNTNWNSPGDDVDGTDSQSDLVVITGNASGNTVVEALKSDGKENVIDGSIGSIAADLNKNSAVLIRVLGTDQGSNTGNTTEGNYTYRNTFSGEAKTTGAGVLKLASRKNGSYTEYFWTLTSVNPNTANFDPVVPGYVLAGKTGLELGYTTLATLHERRGENQILAWDECENCRQKQGQTWGRIFGKQLDLNGATRLNAKQSIYGFQLGHDFAVHRTENGGHQLSGVFMSYASSNTTFSDRFLTDINGNPATNVDTGKGKQKAWYLGVSHTRYAANGTYVDLVGQIGWLQNKFNSKNDVEAKQKGTALTLSAEVGRPYVLRDGKANEGAWLIEPQAQLVYQGLKLKAFHDGTKQVAGGTHHGLRGRIGVRLAYNNKVNEQGTNSFYLIGNLLQDFARGKGANIGQDYIKETHARTWAEIGLGGQLPISNSSYFYADARYERNLGGATREGYRGNIGFKYTWK